MPKLPATIDFNEADHPALSQIFHELDLGIAAIIASDPAFRPKQSKRRSRSASSAAGVVGQRRRGGGRAVAA